MEESYPGVKHDIGRGLGLGVTVSMLSVLVMGPLPDMDPHPQIADPEQPGVCAWPYQYSFYETQTCDTPLITAEVAVAYMGDNPQDAQEIIDYADELETDLFRGILDLSFTVIETDSLKDEYDDLLDDGCLQKSPGDMLVKKEPIIAENDYLLTLSPDPDCNGAGGRANKDGTADVYGVSGQNHDIVDDALTVIHEMGHEVLGLGHSGRLNGDFNTLDISPVNDNIKVGDYIESSSSFEQYSGTSVMGSDSFAYFPVHTALFSCSHLIDQAHGEESPYIKELVDEAVSIGVEEEHKGITLGVDLEFPIYRDVLDNPSGEPSRIKFDKLIVYPNFNPAGSTAVVVYLFSSQECTSAEIAILAPQVDVLNLDMGVNGNVRIELGEQSLTLAA